MRTFFLAGVVCAALAVPAAPVPAQQPVNPATGGSGQQPGPKEMGLTQDQASLSQTFGIKVRSSDRKLLGRISGALVDQQHGATLLGLQRGAGPRNVVIITWADLATVPGSPDNLKLRLAPSALASAVSLRKMAQQHPDYLDVRRDVIGRRTQSEQGDALGTVTDLVVERANGRIDYVLIRTGGVGAGNAAQAVPWKEVAQLPKSNRQPIALHIDKQQLAEAPFFTMKAPLRPAAPNPNDVMNKVPPSGITGTTEAPSGH